MSQILVVEDEHIIRASLKRLLEKQNHEVIEATSVQEALSLHPHQTQIDLIITDLRLPGDPGTQLISLFPQVPVLVMTSYASLKSAVGAMKLGAVDYIAKPFDHQEMVQTVKRILNSKKRSIDKSHKENDQTLEIPGLVGRNEKMLELFRRVHKVSPTDTTVLILGESGTGKELVAKALHQYSQRAQGPLISINCAAIPENLIESELFGYEKGAFTGANVSRKGLVEAADRGSLFLDEIGELPMEAQARLLRLLQEKEIRRVGSVHARKVDVRLIAATHRNLKSLAANGQFREDLYYRLHVVELKLPPLRHRGSDIVDIALHFLRKKTEQLNHSKMQFSTEALKVIQNYHWPGNIRELENAVERAVILCDDDVITPELLDIEDVEVNSNDSLLTEVFSASKPENSPNTPPTIPPSNHDTITINQSSSSPNQFGLAAEDPKEELNDPTENLSLEDYFQRFVLANQDQMTETELAQKLGISRKCLWERRQRLGIPRKKQQLR